MTDQEKKAQQAPMDGQDLGKVAGGAGEIEFDPEPIEFPPISTACQKCGYIMMVPTDHDAHNVCPRCGYEFDSKGYRL